jgi:hypothetical protein
MPALSPSKGITTMDYNKFIILANADLNGQTYRSIGINSDKIVKIGFPNSSGGRTSMAQLLACIFSNCEMISPEQFNSDPKYLQALISLYVNGGKQPAANYSVEFCNQWLNSFNPQSTLAVFLNPATAAGDSLKPPTRREKRR